MTNNDPFPQAINGPDVDHDMDADTDDIPGPIPLAGKIIFQAVPALTTGLGGPVAGEALVALAERTKIASGGVADPSAANPRNATMGVLVGRLSIRASTGAGSTIRKLDGSGFVSPSEGVISPDLGGQVMLSVSGPFQEGDKVVFGSGSSARQIRSADGVASTAVDLEPGMTSIVYVPGGAAILKPSTFVAMAKYAFNNLNNNNALPIRPSTGTIGYAGIEVEGYAYGVVRGGGVESSIVRVTCEAPSGMCQVFGDCTDQDGMSYFGGPVPVPAGATAVWNSDAIAGVLLDGGWDSGRGRCDIFSTAPLAVQHMVRTGHGLINNSVVVGRHVDEDTTTEDAIQRAVNNICNSVGTTDIDGDDDASENGPDGLPAHAGHAVAPGGRPRAALVDSRAGAVSASAPGTLRPRPRKRPGPLLKSGTN